MSETNAAEESDGLMSFFENDVLEYINELWDTILTALDPDLGVDPGWAAVVLLFLIWLRLGSIKKNSRIAAHHLQGIRSGGGSGGSGS